MMDKIIVAIHGIGSQLRSGTIRSVAHRFGDRSCPPLPVMPLGFFNIGNTAEVRVSRLDAKANDPLARIGFAEVFWADIPEQVVKANDTLEETKAWGRTVVSRAEAAYRDNVPDGQLKAQDFQLGVGIVEEIIETIDVMENLLAVAAKMGVFKFELAPLLRDYVGDVQLVTDFPFYREKILYRFHSALAQIVKAFKQLYPDHTPEIYIVAHSEGTVISFLGLLEALSGRAVTDPENTLSVAVPVDASWIDCVRGYMTIGSPIDKHIVLWPKLWKGLQLQSHLDGSGGVAFDTAGQTRLKLKQPIKWRNYYDYGDPIGFQLDAAVEFLHENGCQAFEFDTRRNDFGFSRYWLPGKAHNDYWQDPQVFGHFIEDVVLPTGKAVPPESSLFVDKVSTLIPYVLTFALHWAAVFVLYKAVTQVPDTQAAPVFDRLPLQIALLSGLLMSITVAARLPRLVKTNGIRWELAALLAFLLGAVPCMWYLPAGAADFFGDPFTGLLSWFDIRPALVGKTALVIAAFAIALSGWLVPRRPKIGRQVLIGFGTAVIAVIVVNRLADGSVQAPVWPVLLAGLAFLYLWWLGILLFDLTFVWHRYIRRSVAVQTLLQWTRHKDARPHSMMGMGRPKSQPGHPQ
ncbi:MAG: MFS transporter [Rhodoferax sp.]|nr:MFS transporter [Rhodoferax sp.]